MSLDSSLAETEHAHRLPADTDSTQQLRLRDRHRFFEEVFQHDVDYYLSSAHLQFDYKRPPLGSISSMEVNVDMLEQMDLLDISDQETLDVFFSASGDDGPLPSTLHAFIDAETKEDELQQNDVSLRTPDPQEIKSRILSTSSNSSCDSQASNNDGTNTPLVQSDDEEENDVPFQAKLSNHPGIEETSLTI